MNQFFNKLGCSLRIAIPLLFVNMYVNAQANGYSDIEGVWVFEKAEYMERSSPQQPYQVKQVIQTVEGLDLFAQCYPEAVKSLSVSEVVIVESPFSFYCGRGTLFPLDNSQGRKNILLIGTDEEENGKESPIPGVFFNAQGLTYLAEIIDDNTISLTLEKNCMNGTGQTEGALKCILSRPRH